MLTGYRLRWRLTRLSDRRFCIGPRSSEDLQNEAPPARLGAALALTKAGRRRGLSGPVARPINKTRLLSASPASRSFSSLSLVLLPARAKSPSPALSAHCFVNRCVLHTVPNRAPPQLSVIARSQPWSSSNFALGSAERYMGRHSMFQRVTTSDLTAVLALEHTQTREQQPQLPRSSTLEQASSCNCLPPPPPPAHHPIVPR